MLQNCFIEFADEDLYATELGFAWHIGDIEIRLIDWKIPLHAVFPPGAQFGTVISMPVSGLVCDNLGWECVFYIFGKHHC